MSADNCVVIVKIAKKRYFVKIVGMSEFENITSLDSFYTIIHKFERHVRVTHIYSSPSLKKAFLNAVDLMSKNIVEYGIHYIDLTE